MEGLKRFTRELVSQKEKEPRKLVITEPRGKNKLKI